jgi:NlpC/P60 family putative phage cell wall peptidase
VPRYTPDWSEPSRSEDMLAAAGRHLDAVDLPAAAPGDVLVLRMRDGGVAKHAGILARSPLGHATMIHAYSGHNVVESPLTPAWARRVAGVFRFPDRSA